jgi:pyruvate dehydrogenase E1 component alpha subunit
MEQLVEKYKQMLLIRYCEEAFIEPILAGTIRCPVHLCSGQEAIPVGVCHHLKTTDAVFGNHRSHGHYLAKTGDLQGLVSEVFCRQSGCCGGRGGSMHLYNPEKGFYGSAPIVAGTVSLAAGAALAAKIRKSGGVAVSFFGDGAVGEGVIYESLNFAALQKLPVLFVCENNLYATHMSIDDCRVGRDIYTFVKPLGVQCFCIDGNDIEAVMNTAQEAVQLCRNGKGPVFIECKTYRMRGHVGPDDNIQGTHTDIRPQQEIEEWKTKDPVERTKTLLFSKSLLSEDKDESIRSSISSSVNLSVQKALTDNFPINTGIYDNVF